MAGPLLDSPWGGTTFSPPTALDIATVEAAIVAQLQAAVGNTVEVTHFPDTRGFHSRCAHQQSIIFAISDSGNNA